MSQELQGSSNEELLKEKKLEINKIEKGVQEISELFQTISIFVSQQSEQIDNIETNIINSLGNVSETNIQLKKAEKYYLQKRKYCLYFACMCGMVVIIIIIILVN